MKYDLNQTLILGPSAHHMSAIFPLRFDSEHYEEEAIFEKLKLAKVIIEEEHTTLSRKSYYRKYLFDWPGIKVLWLTDYSTRCNFSRNYAIGYDLVFTAHGKGLELKNHLDVPVRFMPYGFLPNMTYLKKDVAKTVDIGFCGFLGERAGMKQNPIYNYRREIIKGLKDYFGQRLEVTEGLYGTNYNRFLNSCKICINVSALGETNIRIFEVMSTGSALVTDFSKDTNKIFENGKDLLMYRNLEEAIECCERLLSNNHYREIGQHGNMSVQKYERSKIIFHMADEGWKLDKSSVQRKMMLGSLRIRYLRVTPPTFGQTYDK